MLGNGGYAGENLEFAPRVRKRDSAIRSGFEFTQTNTGHDAEGEPLGAFAINTQKLLDYAFRAVAVHVTVETAKRIGVTYYGMPSKGRTSSAAQLAGGRGWLRRGAFQATSTGFRLERRCSIL
jgi:hypothetical protein